MTNYLQGLTDLFTKNYIIVKNNDSCLLGAEKPAIIIKPKKEDSRVFENILYSTTGSVNVITLEETKDPRIIRIQLKEAIKDLEKSIQENAHLMIRINDWNKVSDLYNRLFKNNDFNYDSKANIWIKELLTTVSSKYKTNINDINNYLENLILFLKQMPKLEAIYCLNIFIQAFTIPNSEKYLEITMSANEFHTKKEGDCSEVAVYTNHVLSELGIYTKCYELFFDYSYKGYGRHVLTYYKFKENETVFKGIIDNSKIFPFEHDLPLNMALYKINSHIMMFREIDPKRLVENRSNKIDITAGKKEYYKQLKIVTRKNAEEKIGNLIPLNELFDIYPEDNNILFFKDNALDVIKNSSVSEEEKKNISYFYLFATNSPKKHPDL